MRDLRTDHNPDHPLTKALREVVKQNGLNGAVMLTFTADRVGVNSSSPSPEFGAVMEKLADAILLAFDRGDFDGVLPSEH